jgi:hypothetical protein
MNPVSYFCGGWIAMIAGNFSFAVAANREAVPPIGCASFPAIPQKKPLTTPPKNGILSAWVSRC